VILRKGGEDLPPKTRPTRIAGEGKRKGEEGMTKEGGSLRFREVDELSITVVTDNYSDALRPDPARGSRYRAAPGTSVHAEHGLSYYVRTSIAGVWHSFMFDFGVDGRGVVNNIDLFGIDLGTVDALGLSHGHFDHWGGLAEILRARGSRIPPGTPFYAGKEALARRYAVSASKELQDLGALDRKMIGAAGLEIVEAAEATEIVAGAYLTGSIARVTQYEQPSPVFLVERDGKRVQDDFPGEQALMFLVKGRGLVVLSGCAHAGIVNTITHALQTTGSDHVHAVVGGFHLINAPEERIELTVADIKAFSPDYVVPTHCTGFEAMVRFREEMADRFLLNTAGTTYVFGS
jgi:7,8-dihydropterin-6-yl-methyl-4-(beta-D-ribofuranosyl)aminobenzene 5'-phosphate synthase